jgi:hypothetical protein
MGTPIHGSGARIYLSPGSGEAVPLGEQLEYSIELDADIQEVTALGDQWARFVKGINRWTGSASGNFDLTSKTLWSAGTSTAAQKLYIYPGTGDTLYYYGTAFIKLSKAVAGAVSGKATSGFSFTGHGELGVKP